MSYQVNEFILPKLEGTKFSVAYAINSYHLVTITNAVFNNSFWSGLQYLFIAPSQFIQSIRVYPIDLKKFFDMTTGGETPITMENIKIADKTIQSGTYTAMGYPCRYLRYNNQINKYRALTKIGTISLNRTYNNFLDFNPYTRFLLYLPFYNEIEINPIDFYDENVDVYYFTDFVTGRTTIFIQNSKRVIFTATFQLGYDIPFGATNSVDIARNLINQTTNLLTKTNEENVTGNNLLSFGVNSIMNIQLGYNAKNVSVACENFHNSTNIQIVKITPKLVNINLATYNHLYGKPLMENRILGNLSGYTEIEEIHLTGFNTALKEEVDEIESLLKEGVIL